MTKSINDYTTVELANELRRRLIKQSETDGPSAFLPHFLSHLKDITDMAFDRMNEVNASGDHIAAARFFSVVRWIGEKIKEGRKCLEGIEDKMSTVIIPDMLKAAGVKTVTIEDLGRVTVSYRYSCSMLDKQAGIEWLKESGNGSLVQETVNSSTLAAFSKNMLEVEGKELPPEIFKVGTMPFTSITKVK